MMCTCSLFHLHNLVKHHKSRADVESRISCVEVYLMKVSFIKLPVQHPWSAQLTSFSPVHASLQSSSGLFILCRLKMFFSTYRSLPFPRLPLVVPVEVSQFPEPNRGSGAG